MSYTINHYNNTLLSNIADGTLDTTSTSLSLAGRNFAGYGPYLDSNQVWLLENFAASTSPANPIPGQLWYNSSKDVISVYNGEMFNELANVEMLQANVATLTSQLTANVNTINTAIIANVTVLTANAAGQANQINLLWANAATQSDDLDSLWADSATQSTHLDLIDSEIDAINVAVGLRATIASPTLTGNPRSVTASSGDRSTSIATTAYVMTQDDARRNYVDDNINANISALSSTLTAEIDLRANIASPVLTGTPEAPTPSIGTNNTQIATTAYVMSQDAIRRIYADTQIASNIATLNTAVNNSLALKASLLNPALTGTPTAPTAATGTNTTQIATTAFVRGEISSTNSLWQGSRRFISANTPDSGQGVDGDFWFQYM